MVFIRNLIGGLLAELEDDIDHDRFKRLLHYSRRLASFSNRAKLVSFIISLWIIDMLVTDVKFVCAIRYKKLWKKSLNKVTNLTLGVLYPLKFCVNRRGFSGYVP